MTTIAAQTAAVGASHHRDSSTGSYQSQFSVILIKVMAGTGAKMLQAPQKTVTTVAANNGHLRGQFFSCVVISSNPPLFLVALEPRQRNIFVSMIKLPLRKLVIRAKIIRNYVNFFKIFF
jgi:hypothetical protein